MVQQIGGLISQPVAIKHQLYDDKGKPIRARVVPYSIDFGNAAFPTPQNIDLSANQFKNTLGHVKAMFIDNSANTASVSILCAVTRQTIVIPGGSQAYMPVASSTDQFQISTSGGALVGFDFFNVDIPPCVWSASPGNSTIGSILFAGSAGVDHSANAATYPPTGKTQIITIPNNSSRALVGVQNQSTDAIHVWRTGEAAAAKTLIVLNAAGVAGLGGGAWTSQTFKGVVEVWVTTANAGTDQVSAYED